MNHKEKSPLHIRIYNFSWQSLFNLYQFASACLTGFWLGVLDPESLYQLDQDFYTSQEMYQRDSYNQQGLFDWEKDAIQEHFSGCKKILLIGAGGGREVLALAKLGYQVGGYECNPNLVENAQRLLAGQGLAAGVELCRRDHCPEGEALYDGLIVGWGAYMHIQGRKRRIAFLQEMRSRVQPGAPVLLSFFYRSPSNRRLKVIHFIANLLCRVQFKEPTDLGDDLEPNYHHYFDEDEIASELRSGGFKPVFYRERPYGRAVGTAI